MTKENICNCALSVIADLSRLLDKIKPGLKLTTEERITIYKKIEATYTTHDKLAEKDLYKRAYNEGYNTMSGLYPVTKKEDRS